MLLFAAVLTAPMSAIAQTALKAPKNKYKVQDDIKLGRDAANEVEKQMPVLNDAASTRYVQQVGQRLVAAIPPQFRTPEFNYTFKIVNARDINAFALPGGPMFVNRGMIEAAKNEGEMAGVMAHEISHVALRHGTAQATKQSNPLTQILGIGAIIGGGILGGQLGAQAGAMAAGAFLLKYSREYETQADTLGAQIMARAGYDPSDLANMFRTIEQQSGGSGGPDWFNSHPNPANRYRNIEQEKTLLQVSPEPIKNTPGFEQTKRKMMSLPRARTMAEIEKDAPKSGGTTLPTANGVYSQKVEFPSTKYRTYSNNSNFKMSVPNNWKEMSDTNTITFSPEGAYGKDGITHGVMVGTSSSQSSTSLSALTNEYINGLMQGNSYLKKQGASTGSNMGNRTALATKLSGISPVTGRAENVTVYTVSVGSGTILYFVGVTPQSESATYNSVFNSMRTSMQIMTN